MLPGAVWGAAQPTPQHDVTARLRRCGVAMRLVRRGPEGASRIAMRGPDPLTGAQCRRVDLGVFVSAWRMGVRLAEIPGQALNDPFWPSLCKNVRAPFSCVNFSHVEAISGDLLHRIRLLAILRGGRNEFLHRLGQEPPLELPPQRSPKLPLGYTVSPVTNPNAAIDLRLRA